MRAPASSATRRKLHRWALIASWGFAAAGTATVATGLVPDPPVTVDAFIAAGLAAATGLHGRRRSRAEIEAAFAAGMLHERATGDSDQFADSLPKAVGGDVFRARTLAPVDLDATQVIPLQAPRHRRPAPGRRPRMRG